MSADGPREPTWTPDDVLRAALRHWPVVVGALVIGVVLLGGLELTRPTRYASTAEILVSSDSGLIRGAGGVLPDAARALQTEVLLLRSGRVAARVQSAGGLALPPPRLSARPVDNSNVVRLGVRTATQEAARPLLQAYIDAYRAVRRDVVAGVAGSAVSGAASFAVIDGPRTGVRVAPRPARAAIIGGILGLAAGLALVLVLGGRRSPAR